jgi:hypothetical protein
VRRGLRPPLPGSPEAIAYERELSATRKRLGLTSASDEADDEEDEEDRAEYQSRLWRNVTAHQAARAEEEARVVEHQERILQLWRNVMAAQATNAKTLARVGRRQLEPDALEPEQEEE